MPPTRAATANAMSGRPPPPRPPAKFTHGARVALTVLVPLFILFDAFASNLLRGVAACGVLCGYLLHALGFDESCFIALWLIDTSFDRR